MRLNKWCMKELKAISDERKMICYGAGMVAHHISYLLDYYGILDNVLFFIDNDIYKKDTQIYLENKKFNIKSFDQLYKQEYENTILLVTCESHEAIIAQLKDDQNVCIKDICTYSQLNDEMIKEVIEADLTTTQHGANELYLIPAQIHYCWFGNSDIPEEHKRYIDNWLKKCPDYKFYYWNESNYDIGQCQYVKEAYESGYYAFVTDYVRMDVVYQHGGIYMDTDVDLLRDLDSLRRYKAFFTYGKWPAINSGSGFGAMKEYEMIKEIRDNPRSDIHFCLGNDRYNKTTNCFYESEVLRKHGFKMDFTTQVIDNVRVFSPKYFPSSLYLKENSMPNEAIGLHKDAGSWKDSHFNVLNK